MKDGFLNIVDGRLSEASVTHLNSVYSLLPTGRYFYKIERKDKRSLPQNAYLHGVMLPIVRDALYEAGWNHIKTIEDAKEELIKMFLGYDVVNEKTGEVKTAYRRTHELTKVQFMQLVEDTAIWLQEYFSIELPMPNEQVKLFNQ